MTPPAIQHEPVPFGCAGASFLWKDGQITGRFNPLDMAFWNAVVGFHRAISIKHGAESVSYHKWDEESKQYHTIIPWQSSQENGLNVRTDWKDQKNIALLDEYAKRFGREFFPACTIHTHVDVAAFESGTDAHDEEDNPGWHITLGRLVGYEKYDIAARMRVPKKKALSAVMGTKSSLTLKPSHLFSSNITDKILTIPGTTDWHSFLPRVRII